LPLVLIILPALLASFEPKAAVHSQTNRR